MSTFTPSQTASLAASYVPPFAGTAGTPSSLAISSPTASTLNPNPSTPAFQDDHEWITAYLIIHRLSPPSYRYMYIFWLVIVLIFVVVTILHCTGSRGGAAGGLWSKWSLRRRTWRKKHSLAEARRLNKPHKQPLSLPSNAQLLSIVSLYILAILLCFLGPDYIAPGTHVWDLSHNLTRRDPLAQLQTRDPPVPQTPAISRPSYTIPKAWWTAGGRAGTIAFALFPLCVLFALKSPPFALFALPFLIQIYNDKLAFLHKWSGRLIWFVTALHVIFWAVQLSLDKRGPDNPASVWPYAFEHDGFVYGWMAFIFLTLLVALSLRPIRVEFYETFYILHFFLIPLTLIFSALHFPPIGWWCWAALALWGAERLWRLVRFIRINGILGSTGGGRNVQYFSLVNNNATGRTEPNAGNTNVLTKSYTIQDNGPRPFSPASMDAVDVKDSHAYTPSARRRPYSAGQESMKSFQSGSSIELIPHGNLSDPFSPMTPGYVQSAPQHTFSGSSRGTYIPPPGYAHAVLLPGRTVRLRLVTPHHFSWAPGQHVLLVIPSLSMFTSHPFTIASICNEAASSYEEREIVILSRTRGGFTKRLWTHIEQLQASGKVGDTPSSSFSRPKQGVLLRAYVDGPFGSSIRARWTSYSTVLMIVGGSGVSFAVSLLEYVCLCMAGRNGKWLGGRPGVWGHDAISQITRVRFIWIVREFSHIQWVASVIRKCMDMVPSALQVDIFVTNDTRPAFTMEVLSPHDFGGSLVPPNPKFAQSFGRDRRSSNASEISLESRISDGSHPDFSSMREPSAGIEGSDLKDIVNIYGELGHEEHVLDLTNFDGEDDSALPGESQLSYQLRKEGKLRRAKTRMSRRIPPAKQEPEQREAETSTFPESPYSPRASNHPLHDVPPPTPPKETTLSPTTYTAFRSHFHNPPAPTSPLDSPYTPISPQNARPDSFLSAETNEMPRSASPAPSNKSRTRSKSDMDEAEAEDMRVVSERARPGRAKIDRIVADEAGRSIGPMIVACCGPMSLNAVVRKTVAARIDPSRVLRGEKRANIALVSEEFEW